MQSQSTQETYGAFLTGQGFTSDQSRSMCNAPRRIYLGPLAYTWEHPITGQRGRVFRSWPEARIEFYQRLIYALNHS